eukprot:Gregarina_sp_Pseudo_9__5912@NODE_93_length_4340_cov_42_102767_g85_i0_p2_GENE_NODE_93_length_4340_cov_42_102767_g85_i0NODE_93_length_4340_cov_42_102767_g85_i0_p2_ORF_typecomplete_len297_score27_30Cyclin_N/PF00134_23/1e08_NODE_93_length_4340_cov_42_102767_g85_i013452235
MKHSHDSPLLFPTRIVKDVLPTPLLNKVWLAQHAHPPPHSFPSSPLIEGKRVVAAGLGRAEWRQFYEEELQRSPVDMGLATATAKPRIFGVLQPSVPLEHRTAILKWMCDTCQASRWSPATFFTACHAFDCYVLKCTHTIAPSSLGPLSAACLYFGAHLRESSTDSNIMALDRFRNLCPEIGSAGKVRETEAHLLETLQGVSLGHRAPSDLIVVWLASLLNHNELGSKRVCPHPFRLSLQWLRTTKGPWSARVYSRYPDELVHFLLHERFVLAGSRLHMAGCRAGTYHSCNLGSPQ